MSDLEREVIDLVGAHPQVREIRLVGSRATGNPRPESDWDFRVEVYDFSAVAVALPDLLRPLKPVAEQWDRLSDEQCWMLIVPGPTKVDVIFPEERHDHEPPWEPNRENLVALDAHFWDWTLWLHGKAAGGKSELISTELEKLSDHLLKPLGVQRTPKTLAEAVTSYRTARDAAEQRFNCSVPRELESEVAPTLASQDPD
jgi:predicted nucleotidyltransferase